MIMTEVTPLVDAQIGAFFLAGRPTTERSGCGWAPATATPRRTTRSRSRPARGWSGRPRCRGGAIRVTAPPDDRLVVRSGLAATPAGRPRGAAGAVRGRAARRHRVRVGGRVQRAAPELPRPARGHDRRRAEDDPGQPPHRGAAVAVAAAGAGAAGPVGRAAAHQRRAGGEGGAAVGAEGQHRDAEPRDRDGPARPGGEGAAAGAGVAVQVGVPGEHEPRAAHAAQLDAAARRGCWPTTPTTTSPPKQIEFARTIHSAGSDLLGAHRRHPRPVQDRGGTDGRRAGRGRVRRRPLVRGAGVRAAGRGEGPATSRSRSRATCRR